jgi:hypothetical protein
MVWNCRKPRNKDQIVDRGNCTVQGGQGGKMFEPRIQHGCLCTFLQTTPARPYNLTLQIQRSSSRVTLSSTLNAVYESWEPFPRNSEGGVKTPDTVSSEKYLQCLLWRVGARGTKVGWGTNYVTSRKVAGSILDEVTELFDWPNPSNRNIALGSTQPQQKWVPGIFLGR